MTAYHKSLSRSVVAIIVIVCAAWIGREVLASFEHLSHLLGAALQGLR
jgi:hypothetical protein